MTHHRLEVPVVVLAVGLLAHACGTERTVGSRFVKSVRVVASRGAIISVSASEEPALAGTHLEIPPGALSADTTVTLELGLKPITEASRGPVAIWGPAGVVFSSPVRMTLPLALSNDTERSLVGVQVEEADGRRFTIPTSAVFVEASGSAVSFTVNGFTRFQPTVLAPDAGTGSGGGAAGGSASAGGSAGGSVAGGGVAGGTSVGGGAAGGSGGGGGGATAGGSSGGAAGGSAGDAGTSCALRPLQTLIDFGAVVAGCAVARTVTVHNSCATDQSITFATGAPFSVDPAPVLVPAGGAVNVVARFSPATLGVRAGSLNGTSGTGALQVNLRGAGTATAATTETFVQPSAVTADVLLVISDGPNMASVQQALATGLPNLIQYANTTQVDYQFAVLIGRPDGGALVQGSAGAPLVVSSITPNAAQTLTQKVSLGQGQAPPASCLTRAFDSLAADAGWLRPNANLGVVCVQNTVDTAAGEPAAWVAALERVKGATRRGQVSINALGSFAPNTCNGSDDVILRAASVATGGAIASVCPTANDLTPVARPLSETKTFFLHARPAADAGVVVAVDSQVVPTSGWSLDPALNAIVFDSLSVPAPGTTLTVSFPASCTP
jgi:hypothetical protein